MPSADGHRRLPWTAVAPSDLTPPLRGAVLGLGMIGRHHARLLQAMDRVVFAGAADPGGDRFGAVRDPALVLGTAAELLDRGRPDFAVVATPTEEHVETVRTLAAAGMHVLVEKPLAATSGDARAIIDLCAGAGVRAA